MIILGINAYHADASASILKNGKLIAAVEEERFRRVKHWAGFPTQAIQYCLERAGVSISEVDHISISRDPKAHFLKKIWFAIKNRPRFSYLINRIHNLSHVQGIQKILSDALSVQEKDIRASFHYIEHHRAHMGSSFFVSSFDKAAVVSIDALGDYVSTMWALGKGNKLQVLDQIQFPHSLGFLYTAATQYLGFPNYGDEYKVMGLAAYGKPVYVDVFRKMIHLDKGRLFELDLSYFRHHNQGVAMTWEEGQPVIERMWSEKWEKQLGVSRQKSEEIQEHHQNIAASVQAVFEEVYFRILNKAYELTKLDALCLAGGCAMNSVANGKIFDHTPFREVYIQPAAGDAGTSIGAAFYVYHQILNQPRNFVMKHSYWGPHFEDEAIEKVLSSYEKLNLGSVKNINGCKVRKAENEAILCQLTAQAIADGKVVGWFQGSMEWGARALGNRSILADPRREEIRDILNVRIKKRELFRPFAPSILLEKVGEYFEKDYPDPFMLKVYSIRPEKRSVIPAVTHIDGTGRLQTVTQEENVLYWQLLKEFEKITGVPVILNTSFNENEPIVCNPKQALDCLLRTKMDMLVMGSYIIERSEA